MNEKDVLNETPQPSDEGASLLSGDSTPPEAAPAHQAAQGGPPEEVRGEDAAWVAEADLAAQWGVSRERLRKLREALTEGVEWRRDFRVIEYSAAGIEAVKLLLQERMEGDAEVLPEETLPPGRARAVVTRCWRNERLLQADIAGRSCRVRVRSNENFVPGMRFEAVHEHDDVFRYEGRLPRRKGVW